MSFCCGSAHYLSFFHDSTCYLSFCRDSTCNLPFFLDSTYYLSSCRDRTFYLSFSMIIYAIFRSSHQRCSTILKGVLRNFTNSQENTCARVSFLIKLQTSGLQFIKKESLAQVFSWEISRNTFVTEHVWAAAFLSFIMEKREIVCAITEKRQIVCAITEKRQ